MIKFLININIIKLSVSWSIIRFLRLLLLDAFLLILRVIGLRLYFEGVHIPHELLDLIKFIIYISHHILNLYLSLFFTFLSFFSFLFQLIKKFVYFWELIFDVCFVAFRWWNLTWGLAWRLWWALIFFIFIC